MKLTTDLLAESIDEALLCPSCSEPYDHAVVTKCGHSFCRGCIKVNSPCMICNETISNGDVRTVYTLMCQIDNLSVKCKNHTGGCKWTGTAKESSWHEELCSKRKKERGTLVSDDELAGIRKDLTQLTPSKPDVTCKGADDRKFTDLVATYIPMEQILDFSFDLEETMGVQNTVLIYDPNISDFGALTVLNHDNPGAWEDEQELKDQEDKYKSVYSRFFAKHWVNVNGFMLPCDPHRHPFIHRRDLLGWNGDIKVINKFMHNYFPISTNGVAFNLPSTPPPSPSSDEEQSRRKFAAFYLPYVQIAEGSHEIKIHPDSTDALLPRDKALLAIKHFMDGTKIAKEAVAIRGIKKNTANDHTLIQEFLAMYLPYLQYDHVDGRFEIIPQYQDRFIHRGDVVNDASRVIDRIGGPLENLASVPSMGKKGEDGGGVYQTIPVSQSFGTIEFIIESSMFQQLLSDFPLIQNETLRFMDAGSGMCYPCLTAAIYAGWKVYGLENDCNRVALAASFLRQFMGSSLYGNHIDIACLHRDITSPGNFSGIHIFYFWDKAMDYYTAIAFFRNIHRSMSSHDVLLLMSTKFLHDPEGPRLQALKQYFHVREGPTHKFKHKGSYETDTIQLFRLSRRIDVYTSPPPRALRYTAPDSDYIDVEERIQELDKLAQTKWRELAQRKRKRSAQ